MTNVGKVEGARHFSAFFLWFNAAGLLTLPGAKAGLQKPAGYKATPGKPGFRNWVYRAQGVPGYREVLQTNEEELFLVFLARGVPRAKNTF